ncbi:MAG TPA: HAMP domain-containing protein [Spirochaetota bacterium]|nr:HAMP domain-containing protein [Spirochaetota bacterium]HNT10804.1 HAMP domain-containing protein [Spirochaetota bacterium]
MGFKRVTEMSRLKKKLLLYFLLISIVSLSVSAEIILEFSSPRFRNAIRDGYLAEVKSVVPAGTVERIRQSIHEDIIFKPISDLRNRMILFMIVVTASIVGAFFLFTKDIVSPMDGMVDATKKIADGDLTVTVPVMSEDEIGQIGRLINDMNVNLQDMIMQIRQEIDRHQKTINYANELMTSIVVSRAATRIIEERRIKRSEFDGIIKLVKEVLSLMDMMSEDLAALQSFVNMYKTYRIPGEANTAAPAGEDEPPIRLADEAHGDGDAQ